MVDSREDIFHLSFAIYDAFKSYADINLNSCDGGDDQ
jgi:hypothetical protein